MGWDTKVTGLPVGGYVINQESSKLNKSALEAMKFDNSKYPTTPAEVGNNEFVFTPKEVDMYGIDKMDELNNSAKEAAHSSIDGLMAMNTLSQIPAMAGGGSVGNENIAGYENGGMTIRRGDLSLKNPEYQKLDDRLGWIKQDDGDYEWASNEPLEDVLSQLIDASIGGNTLRSIYTNYGKDVEKYKKYVKSGKGNENDKKLLDELIKATATPKRLFEKGAVDLENLNFLMRKGYQLDEGVENIPVKKLEEAFRKERNILGEIGLPAGDYGYDLKTKYNERDKEVFGYQRGGSVSDATATSAMDELLAQAMLEESAQGQSQYSMVDADKVDAQNQEMLDMITSMALPGGFGGALGAIGKIKPMKLVKHATRIMENRPKPQRVLDKIASTMKVAPKSGKPFNSKELINKGYLQKYINNLVKLMGDIGWI